MRRSPIHKPCRPKGSWGLHRATGGPVEAPDEPAPQQNAMFIIGDRLHTRLAERAYYLAERRGFEPRWRSSEFGSGLPRRDVAGPCGVFVGSSGAFP